MPEKEEFKYQKVLQEGMPVQDEYFYMKHPRMPYGKRAKIFAPFAALKGFEEEVESKEVLYVGKKILDEDACEKIDGVLRELYELTAAVPHSERRHVRAAVEYYIPCLDEHHEDYLKKGTYETLEDVVKGIDPYEHVMWIGEENIRFEDISRIEIQGT